MIRFHDCAATRCQVDPLGKEWPKKDPDNPDPKADRVYDPKCVFDNDSGKLVTREEAKTLKPKVG